MFFSDASKMMYKRPNSSRRPFSTEEDMHLINIMSTVQFVNWEQIANQMVDRTSRQCRERWVNYLNPKIRTDPWTDMEDTILLEKVNELGRCWSNIGRFFNGRSENDVKNRWYSHLRYRTVEKDGKIQLITDPAESPFPERKKRHRTKIPPQKNAMRMLEQQKFQFMSQQLFAQQQQQQMQQQMQRQQMFPILAMNSMQQQPPYPMQQSTMRQFQRPPVHSAKLHQQPKQTQTQNIVVPLIMTSREGKSNTALNPTMNTKEGSDMPIPEPEINDFWDMHLLDEANNEFQAFPSFNEFALY